MLECLLHRDDGALEPVLRSLEIGLPRSEPLLDALLDRRDLLRHPIRELALAGRELSPLAVRQAPLLCDIARQRVSVCARDGDA
jgi:hypothetical protein